MSINPILVTGAAAGKGGSVGKTVVELLRKKDLPVRALVHSDDERATQSRKIGAEVVVGDLTEPQDVVRILKGCRRVYFGMAVSPPYLEATAIMAAAAKAQGDLEALINISQRTVSQMSLTQMTDSDQQKQHWLAEQVLNWSALPVVHVRATVFLNHFFFSNWAAETIAKDGTIRLPFGSAYTSPVAVDDVANVIATILENPTSHIGKVYELTGPKSQNMDDIAKEYAQALGRPVKYVDMPFNQWREKEFKPHALPEHVQNHILTMAQLHADNRYNRMTNDVAKITGKPAISIKDFVIAHPELFKIAVPN